MENNSIRLVMDSTWVIVHGKMNKKVLSEVKSCTSYRPEGYQFMQSFKSGRWDGVFHLFQNSYGEQKFPTGMIHDVVKVLKDNSVNYVLEDARLKKDYKLDYEWNNDFRQLRDYQKEAVETAIKRTRGIIRLPTGSGKMLVAARIIFELKKKATIFVMTEEAVKDTYEEFCEAIKNAKIGRWSGTRKDYDNDIVVATIQSLYEKNRGNAKELYNHFVDSDVVIFDEVHATGANEYYALAKLSNALYKFGQSGTPFRGDGKDILLQAATGRIIYKKTTKELQDSGYLAGSKVLFFKTKMPSDHTPEELAELTPHDKYRTTIIENDHRNALIKEVFKKYANQPTLVIVKHEQHLKFLSDYLGIPLVYGKSSKGYRKAVQEQLKSGEMWCVVATKVYDQSVNIPSLKVAINCAGHSPKNAQIQRLGRILRNSNGNDALFIDFWDEFETSVLVHSRNRLDYLKEEGHEIEIKEMNYKLDISPEDIKKYRPIKDEGIEVEEYNSEDDYEFDEDV